LLTGGQVADCTTADALLDQMPATTILHGDKGYDIHQQTSATMLSWAAASGLGAMVAGRGPVF